MSKFDAWLERPYTEAAQKAADYEKFCEKFSLNPDSPWTAAAFDVWLSSFDTEIDPIFTEETS
jgi:hypothetical protein